jgi:hypothetical protein
VIEDKRIKAPSDLTHSGYHVFGTQGRTSQVGSVPVPEGATSARLSFLSYGNGPNTNNDFNFAINDASISLQTGSEGPSRPIGREFVKKRQNLEQKPNANRSLRVSA